MKLADLPTPCLVLDREILRRNIRAMAGVLARHRLPLRPHMKTAKSIDVARLAIEGQPGGITVSTLAEAEYFAAHGITDILYAVAITPQKLGRLRRLTDDVWSQIDVLVVPSVPRIPRAAEVEAEPVAVNSMLGTYTNFVNLLDLCALTIPVGEAGDGPPASITLIAPAGADRLVSAVGRQALRGIGASPRRP